MRLRLFTLCVLLLSALRVHAVVDPLATTQVAPGWMADLYVWDARKGKYGEFCKGALVAPYWVLSTGLCLVDPDHQLEALYPGDQPKFQIRIGPNADSVEVDGYFVADDYRVALFHMALPSGATPLPVSKLSAAQLLGSDVTLLGKQRSASIFHALYNPGVSANEATCKFGSVDFTGSGTRCFLRRKTSSSFYLYQAAGKVIDPLGVDAPATTLDKQVKLDTSGKQLYVDFRSSKSYPCFEDMGSPLLLKQADGSYEIAAVVSGVGIAGGVPICGMSLANVFASADTVRTFIEKSIAAWDFRMRCPGKPEPAVSYSGATGVTLRWSGLKGATGYKVHFTEKHGQSAVTTVDVKAQTTLTTQLMHGVDYLVAVTAYNANCSGQASRPLAINVDVR